MQSFIKKTLELLDGSPEWQERYSTYLTEIWNHEDKWKKLFHKPEGLSLYTSVATRNEKFYFLRFKGQNVGKISVNREGEISLKCLVDESKSHDIKDCPLSKDVTVDWDSEEATKFREFFNDLPIKTKTKSPEHHVENSLLKEFCKRNGDEKLICNIQPVVLHGYFFQMPTPLKASKHNPEYSGHNGGGIDLMARIRDVKGHLRLCVCEVKDKNENSESQRDAMSQAVTYATFIAKLLVTQPDWWEFFSGHPKHKGRISNSWDKKHIEVVTMMPAGDTETFDNMELEVPGTDIKLVCRTLYYDKDIFENENKFIFSGSFLKEIKQ